MQKWLLVLAGLAAMAGSAFWFGPGQGYAQDQAPSELRAFPSAGDPFGTARQPTLPTAPSTRLPSYAGGSGSFTNQGTPAATVPDPTAAYLVTPGLGPWLICVQSYTGPEAPGLAVQLVQELRNHYKLPAYVFNYGAEERRKEMERVAQIVQKQREYLKQMNVPPDPTTKIRVRHMRIEEQCAVLVGGYRDMEAARRGLDAVKQLQPPDPKLIKVQHEMFIVGPGGKLEKASINPFTHGFVVRNPAVPAERLVNQDNMDIAVLRKLNSGEPFSLLQCSKKYTLAITQLQTPTVVQPRSASGSFLDNLGLGAPVQIDAAAQSAHSLAELLRKANQEAYVLHTKFSSVVTVGGYDSVDDPRLKHDQERLAKLHLPPVVRLFPQPMPMAIPH